MLAPGKGGGTRGRGDGNGGRRDWEPPLGLAWRGNPDRGRGYTVSRAVSLCFGVRFT